MRVRRNRESMRKRMKRREKVGVSELTRKEKKKGGKNRGNNNM